MLYKVCYNRLSYACHKQPNLTLPNPQACPQPGFYIDLAIYALRLLDPSALIQPVDVSGFPLYGTVSQQHQYNSHKEISAVLSGRADITPPYMTLTEGRAGLLPYVGAINQASLYFVFKELRQSSLRSLNFFTLFPAPMLIAFVIITATAYCAKSTIAKHTSRQDSTGAASKFLQGFQQRGGLVLAMWYGIFLGCLSSFIVSVFQKDIPPQQRFNNVQDIVRMLKAGRASILTEDPFIYHNYLNPINVAGIHMTEAQRSFQAAARRTTPRLLHSNIAMNLLFNSTEIYIFAISSLDTLRSLYSQHCGLNHVKAATLGNIWKTMYLRTERQNLKGALVKNGLDTMLQVERRYLLNLYFPVKNCHSHVVTSRIVQLYQILTPFYGMLGVYAIGLGIFMLESGLRKTLTTRWDMGFEKPHEKSRRENNESALSSFSRFVKPSLALGLDQTEVTKSYDVRDCR